MASIIRNNKKGVTLVELLVVIAVIAIIAGVAGDILLSVIRGYKKAQVIGEVEQNGTLVSTLLENKLRSASLIEYESGGSYLAVGEGATKLSNSIRIYSADGGETDISFTEGTLGGDCINGIIDIDGVSMTNTNSEGGVNVSGNPGEIFTIYNPVGSPPVVTVNFNVNQGCKNPITASAVFNTTVTLRGSYGD